MNRYLCVLLFFLFHFVGFSQSIKSVVPDEAQQGEELEVTVTGENTTWSQASNVLMFTQGSTTIYPNPQTVVNDTIIKGYFYFTFSHPTGFYDVEVEEISSGDRVVLENGFMLNEGDQPILTSVDPDSSEQVDFITVTVTGENTQFTQGSSLLMFKGEYNMIYPSDQNIYSDTVMDGDFFINPDHVAGLYDVRVNSNDPPVILEDGFTVLQVENMPEILTIDPDSAFQGEMVIINVTSEHTHFDYPDLDIGVKLETYNHIIYAQHVDVVDSVHVEVWFSFDYTHTPEVYDLIVYDDLDGTMTLEESFELLAGTEGPQIVSVVPDDAEQGQSLWVTITGQQTVFTSGTATIKFNQGSSTIYPTEQNVLNDTVIEGDFEFSIEDKEGYYDVYVFDLNGNWSVREVDGFYLYPYVFVEEFRDAAIGTVYPNPATQLLFIRRNPKIKSGIAIDILNMAGEIVHLDEMTENQQLKSINVTNIESGVYLIHLRSANEVYSKKIVIK